MTNGQVNVVRQVHHFVCDSCDVLQLFKKKVGHFLSFIIIVQTICISKHILSEGIFYGDELEVELEGL